MNVPQDLSIPNPSGDLYDSVRISSLELVLQPRCSRAEALRIGWSTVKAIGIFLPFITILPTLIVTIVTLAIIGATVPIWQNHWITNFVIVLLWVFCLTILVFLIGQGLWTSGYRTYSFDRIQQQLVVNTENLLGQKYVRAISFNQIQDAQLRESNGNNGQYIQVTLQLKKHKSWGFTRQEVVSLSSFRSSQSIRNVATCIARQHHQELLRLVRNALGFSTDAIVAELQRSARIPTAEELQYERKQKKLMGENVLKMNFSGKQAKLRQLAAAREKTYAFSQDPYAWENLAFMLNFQKKSSKHEMVSAYRQAAALYREQGNVEAAMSIDRTLHLLHQRAT
jgi:hypothetical protein